MTEAEPPNILDHLGIVPIEQDQLPYGHKALSVPLSIQSDTTIIASMWATLRSVCKRDARWESCDVLERAAAEATV
jgi:hypothetical protein